MFWRFLEDSVADGLPEGSDSENVDRGWDGMSRDAL